MARNWKIYNQTPKRKAYLKKYNRKWSKANPEKCRENRIKYQERHPERRKEFLDICDFWHKKMKTPIGKFEFYKDNAQKRSIKWELFFEQFMTFWQKPCYYCGDKIETIGLDRVDNLKGYIIDNVVSCCWTCNRMKRQMSRDEFSNFITKIYKHLNLAQR